MDSQTSGRSSLTSSLDPQEMDHFSQLASRWWEETGPFSMLHKINPVRMAFIRKALEKESLAGLSILDVGCGGGLISEPLARLGAQVTAIDGVAENIQAAQAHSKAQGLSIDYRHGGPEDLLQQGLRFDAIIGLEVLEHVADPDFFLGCLSPLVKEDGVLILSTLNRTVQSYLLGIIAAEHLLKWVPKGTHQWRKFIQPRHLQKMLFSLGFQGQTYEGLSLNPLSREWEASPSLAVNYFVAARRKGPLTGLKTWG